MTARTGLCWSVTGSGGGRQMDFLRGAVNLHVLSSDSH